MKTMLFLNDETIGLTLLSRNPVPVETALHKSERIICSNCDRWGHLCRADHDVGPKPDFPTKSSTKK